MQKKEKQKRDFNSSIEKTILKFKKSKDEGLRNQILSSDVCRSIVEIATVPFLRSELYDDLKQDAYIGITKAINNYRKGGNFYACAAVYAKREIYDQYHKYVCPVKISVLAIGKNKLIMKFIAEFQTQFGRTPTEQEISRGINMKESRVNTFLNINRTTPLGDISEMPIKEKAEDMSEDFDLLYSKMENLSEIERYIVRESYGMDSEPKTLDKIAANIGKTKQRVSQIRMIALKKLKRELGRKIC